MWNTYKKWNQSLGFGCCTREISHSLNKQLSCRMSVLHIFCVSLRWSNGFTDLIVFLIDEVACLLINLQRRSLTGFTDLFFHIKSHLDWPSLRIIIINVIYDISALPVASFFSQSKTCMMTLMRPLHLNDSNLELRTKEQLFYCYVIQRIKIYY